MPRVKSVRPKQDDGIRASSLHDINQLVQPTHPATSGLACRNRSSSLESYKALRYSDHFLKTMYLNPCRAAVLARKAGQDGGGRGNEKLMHIGSTLLLEVEAYTKPLARIFSEIRFSTRSLIVLLSIPCFPPGLACSVKINGRVRTAFGGSSSRLIGIYFPKGIWG